MLTNLVNKCCPSVDHCRNVLCLYNFHSWIPPWWISEPFHFLWLLNRFRSLTHKQKKKMRALLFAILGTNLAPILTNKVLNRAYGRWIRLFSTFNSCFLVAFVMLTHFFRVKIKTPWESFSLNWLETVTSPVPVKSNDDKFQFRCPPSLLPKFIRSLLVDVRVQRFMHQDLKSMK